MQYSVKSEKNFELIITVLFSLFLLSLTNSIFVNQLGYFGALFIILLRFFITKKNPFHNSGLEYPFLFFISAMVLSTLFSVDKSSSFENLLKRLLLIPVLYTTLSFCSDEKKLKFATKFFLAFAVISIFIYIIFAVQHLISNLYGVQQSGPGLFHYPITTSEIMSFVVIIFFAFLLNEKGSWKKRLSYLVLFALSSVALIATYKRTGWIGAFAGIIYVIILNRKYLYLAIISLVILVAFMLDTQSSNVYVIDLNNQGSTHTKISSEGRAQSVLPLDKSGNTFLLSDFQNGLVLYKDNKAVEKVLFQSPVNETMRVNDSTFLTYLSDTRFILWKTGNQAGSINLKEYSQIREFISPGYTRDYKYFNNTLYILDKDSGLTVFRDLFGILEIQRTLVSEEYEKIAFDSSGTLLFAPGEFLTIITEKNTFVKLSVKADFLFCNESIIFLSTNEGLRTNRLSGNKIVPVESNSGLKDISLATYNDSNIFFGDNRGNIYITRSDSSGRISITRTIKIGSSVNSIAANNSYLYATSQKQSRLWSIFDPYNPSNTTRIQLWTAGLKILKDYSVFGVGDIDLAKLYIKYKNYYDKEIQGHLHNNFFHILAILGIVGFLTFLYLFVRIIIVNFRIYRSCDNSDFLSSLSLGINGAFIAFVFSGLTEWNFGDHEIITMVWFLIGLNIAVSKITSNKINLNRASST